MKAMKIKLSIAGAALAAAAVVGGVAWACVPGASIAVNPGTGTPGTGVSVTGTTFDSQGSLVNIYWEGTSGSLVGQAPVQADRTFSFSFVVPGNAPSGSHVVSATQLDRNGLAYNPVNRAFRVSGTRPANPTNAQGPAQAEPADGATTPAPAAAQPAAQPAPRAAVAPAQASAPAQPGTATPGPGVGTQGSSPAPPQVTAAESQSATAQQPAGSQEAFRTPVPAPAPAGAGEAVSSSSGPPAWILAPLALLSLGFLGAGSGIFIRERRRVRVKA